eukprot:TRINITY_DN6753_c0_g1_i6.p1 TRINITY_DN6753_c0_g1~~TRINITY_DN6753_c0_g1_i6.p1  ORF type:complete len:566 (-),score=108.36 TRINITY_DN6753_c0_g1_i6:298-1995(-)
MFRSNIRVTKQINYSVEVSERVATRPVGIKRKQSGAATTVERETQAVDRKTTREASLKESPLLAGGLAHGPSALLPGWTASLQDERRRSFVAHRASPFKKETLREWWHLLSNKLQWSRPKVGGEVLPRSAVWLTNESCKCTYRYSGTAWPAHTMEPWFQAITEEVGKACGLPANLRPNCCNANYYADGTQLVGWHADDEPLFDAKRQDALIVSLSLGSARFFEVRLKARTKGAAFAMKPVVRLRLGDGDLCVMEGLMQKHYLHRVPREASVGAARINLTWRWIVKHDRGCPCESGQLSKPEKPALAASSRKRKAPLPPPPPVAPPPPPAATTPAATLPPPVAPPRLSAATSAPRPPAVPPPPHLVQSASEATATSPRLAAANRTPVLRAASFARAESAVGIVKLRALTQRLHPATRLMKAKTKAAAAPLPPKPPPAPAVAAQAAAAATEASASTDLQCKIAADCSSQGLPASESSGERRRRVSSGLEALQLAGACSVERDGDGVLLLSPAKGRAAPQKRKAVAASKERRPRSTARGVLFCLRDCFLRPAGCVCKEMESPPQDSLA